MSLDQLHDIIQVAFDWTNSHLHQFTIDGVDYSTRGLIEEFDDMGTLDESRVMLEQVVPKKVKRFRYIYDFGDDWIHEVLVEKIEEVGQGDGKPACTGGKRHRPPEDCGGPWGYAELLDAIGDPKHERHEELLDWIGGSFDPEAFDIEAVNRMLARWR